MPRRVERIGRVAAPNPLTETLETLADLGDEYEFETVTDADVTLTTI